MTWSAPSALAFSILASSPTVVITLQPIAFAIRIADEPIPEPAAPGTKPVPLGKFEVPQKYRDPATSGLVAQVKEGSNDIPIESR